MPTIKNNRVVGVMVRDCRKDNPSARREINGIMFQAHPPRKGETGRWRTENGRVELRQKSRDGRSPWRCYLDGREVGNNQLTNLSECIRANEWAIRKGL